MIVAPAYAKINLSLEVVGRRADGFHDLVSVMQTVSLVDSLEFEPDRDLLFTCSDRTLTTGNLVLRAAALLRDRYGVQRGCRIHLQKHIPTAAGLGGGSSDAAVALITLAAMWNVKLTCSNLLDLAAALGSDVPFFLWSGTCLVEGRGERVSPLRSPDRQWYLLVNPRIEVSTERIFAALPVSDWTDGTETHALARDIVRADIVGIGRNGLQPTLFRLYPEARECYDAVTAVSAHGALVSGSGPTVLAPFPTQVDAMAAFQCLQGTGYWAMVVAAQEPAREYTPCR
jgi:4-diphosphocytidyl-2-C-methyl-D-erythritol kinase